MGCIVRRSAPQQYWFIIKLVDHPLLCHGGVASAEVEDSSRIALHLPGNIKMVDHPWLWHGVLTRMVVLEDRPRIVASRDRITTVEDGYEAKDFAFIYNIPNRRLRPHVPGSIKMID